MCVSEGERGLKAVLKASSIAARDGFAFKCVLADLIKTYAFSPQISWLGYLGIVDLGNII